MNIEITRMHSLNATGLLMNNKIIKPYIHALTISANISYKLLLFVKQYQTSLIN